MGDGGVGRGLATQTVYTSRALRFEPCNGALPGRDRYGWRHDDWVVVAFQWRVRGEGSGIETQLGVATAVRVKEGRIIEWHNRWSRAEALEAAGLQE
jgi:hypothetical protein